MKKKLSMLSLLGAAAILIGGAVLLSSCEGPEGPAGTNGTNGVDGVNGADGADANSTCILCHSDDQVIVTKSKQYGFSGHNTGHTAGYTNRSFGPAYDCAGCHTSQGFLAALTAGSSTPPYSDITQPNCYTCHEIHSTYTADDWALTSGTPVVPFTNDVYDSPAADLGAGNQCARCHQFVSSYLADETLFLDWELGTETVVIPADNSKKRVGVHHAPQYNIVANMDLFEFDGSLDYPESNHITSHAADGCVTCHMNDGFGDLTGHSMSMTYDFHGPDNYHWSSSCTACHSDTGDGEDLDDKVETSLMPEITGLLDNLYVVLTTAGVLGDETDVDADGGSMQYYLMPGTWTTDLVAAVVNYNAIREDKSLGFHNPKYIRAILTNTAEAVD